MATVGHRDGVSARDDAGAGDALLERYVGAAEARLELPRSVVQFLRLQSTIASRDVSCEMIESILIAFFTTVIWWMFFTDTDKQHKP